MARAAILSYWQRFIKGAASLVQKSAVLFYSNIIIFGKFKLQNPLKMLNYAFNSCYFSRQRNLTGVMTNASNAKIIQQRKLSFIYIVLFISVNMISIILKYDID